MVGTKEKLDKRGNIVCRDEDTLYWCEKAWYDTLDADQGIEIDWKWEARCNFKKELALKFINDYDYWEKLKEIVRDALASSWEDEVEVKEMLEKEGIVALAHTDMIDSLIDDLVCWESDDISKEYVEWLN